MNSRILSTAYSAINTAAEPSEADLTRRGRGAVVSSFAAERRSDAERRTRTKRYWRDLIVRAVEDFIVLFIGGVAVWAVCWLVGGIFQALGVG